MQKLVKSLPGKDRSNITIHDISKLRFIKLKCFKLIVARNNKGSETLSRGWFLKGLKKENKKEGVSMGFLDKLFRKSKEMDHMSNVKLALFFIVWVEQTIN